MTMKRLAIIVIVLWTAWAGAAAQNEVDRMVNHLSTIGTASFTSAVERDSKTHKIIKVVNKLVMSGPNVKSSPGHSTAKRRNRKTPIPQKRTISSPRYSHRIIPHPRVST